MCCPVNLTKFLVIGVIGLVSIQAPAQIYYAHAFTRKLERCQAQFAKPLEGYYKIKFLKKNTLVPFDLVLESRDFSFEHRFILDPDYQLDVPHVSSMALAATLAINEEKFSLTANCLSAEEAAGYYGADWAVYIDFVPKPEVTLRHYARLVTLYKEGAALIHHLMLFDYHDDEQSRRLYMLGFDRP